MANPSIVQQSTAQGAGGNTDNPFSFSTQPTIGNYVYVLTSSGASSSAGETCFDNQGHTYTKVIGRNDPSNTVGRVSIWRTKITASSGTFTVTMRDTGSSSNTAQFFELTGVSPTTPEDGTAGFSDDATFSATSATVSAGSPTIASGFDFLAISHGGAGAVPVFTSPLSTLGTQGSAGANALLYTGGGGDSSTGALSLNATWTGGAAFIAVGVRVRGVAGGPNVTANPSAQHAAVGATATFTATATASGGGTLSWQAKLNGSNISGATGSGGSASYTTGTLGLSDDGGSYSFDFTETGGTTPGTTGTTSATLYVGIRVVGANTPVFSTSGGTSVSPSYSTLPTIQSGDEILLIVAQKPSTANSGSVTTPTGFTLVNSLTGAGGYSTTLGNNTGNTNLFVYRKNSVTGTESGALSVTVGTNNIASATFVLLRAPSGQTFSFASTTGSDTSSGNVSLAGAADPGVTAGDVALLLFNGSSALATYSGEGVTQTGVTYGSVTELAEPSTTTGNDVAGFIAWAKATSGTSSAAPTWTATTGGTTTNARGPGIFVRARASGANSYSLTCASGSLTLTGNAAGLAAGRKVAANAGSLALTGNAAGLKAGRKLASAVGSCTLTGNAAGLAAGRKLLASVGTFTLAGNAASFVHARYFTASLGSFTWTGLAAGLKAGRKLACAVGSVTFTGNAANLLGAHKLVSIAGSFAWTGNAATLTHGRYLTAASGAFALTANAAGIAYGHKLLAASGTFAFTGVDAALNAGNRLTAAVGSFALTGNAAGLKAGRKTAANAGSFALTGSSAAFVHARFFTASAGSFALTGPATGLRAGRKLASANGEFAFTGNAAGLTYTATRSLLAANGAFAWTGNAAALRAQRRAVAATGAFSLTGGATAFSSAAAMTAGAGAFALTGSPAGLRKASRVVAGGATFALTAPATALRAGRTMLAAAAAFALVGQAATFAPTRRLAASSGAYSLVGGAVTLAGAHRVTLSPGAFVETGGSAALLHGYRLVGGNGAFAWTGNPATFTSTAPTFFGVVISAFAHTEPASSVFANATAPYSTWAGLVPPTSKFG